MVSSEVNSLNHNPFFGTLNRRRRLIIMNPKGRATIFDRRDHLFPPRIPHQDINLRCCLGEQGTCKVGTRSTLEQDPKRAHIGV